VLLRIFFSLAIDFSISVNAYFIWRSTNKIEPIFFFLTVAMVMAKLSTILDFFQINLTFLFFNQCSCRKALHNPTGQGFDVIEPKKYISIMKCSNVGLKYLLSKNCDFFWTETIFSSKFIDFSKLSL